jgi:hypothetical protein
MSDSKTQRLGGTQHGGGRSRTSGHHLDGAGELGAARLSAFDHEIQHGRGATHVRHVVSGYGVEDRIGCRLAQTDMGAASSGYGPREAPAIAVEHREGPQINGWATDAERLQLTLEPFCRSELILHLILHLILQVILQMK